MKIDLHHMLGGRVGRVDAPWNFLALCSRWGMEGCHERLDKGRENLAIALTLKLESDPANADLEAMQAHLRNFGREILVEPAELPQWILDARN